MATTRSVCETCKRPLPKERPDEPTGPKRTRFQISEPTGEEGILDDLLTQLVDRYQESWPDTLGPVGSEGWRYRAAHFAFYSVLTAPPGTMDPRETGG